ncbi:MAG: succinate dehydrogenase, hydrophobic membrane anchor protein [Zoogloeaceae bacterium]|jgi:succinate dehydrogenase / fumarate reductase membrane anchor subunit|nr:succinate dehydrogenase, hydrophobic membrane anchor protein [Zoogloeaceae bacterium]
MANRIFVGAHYGLKDWIIQRVTAVYMALYTLVAWGVLLTQRPRDFAAWQGIFACGVTRYATFIFALCLFYHVWIGVRDIWMDYVKPTGLRLALHALTVLVLAGYAGWVAAILWRL